MDEIANSTFIYLTESSYDYGLITQQQYHSRISKLYELNGFDPNDYDFLFYNKSEAHFENTLFKVSDDENREFSISELGLSEATKINEQLFSKDNALHFISGQSGKYCKWKFNEYDVDDKPSIPHGHFFLLRVTRRGL